MRTKTMLLGGVVTAACLMTSYATAQTAGPAAKSPDEAMAVVLPSATGTVPLERALAELSHQANVALNVNWNALAGAFVHKDTLVALRQERVPGRDRLLAILAIPRAGEPLGFFVEGGTVSVSTQSDLRARYQQVRVFDVSALMADVDRDGIAATRLSRHVVEVLETTVEPDSWRDHGGAVGSARVVNGQLIVSQAYDIMPAVERVVHMLLESAGCVTRSYDVRDLLKGGAPSGLHTTGMADELMQAIETTCGRDTWRDRGGRTSSIAAFDGTFYVTTTPAVHQEIEALLGMMRKKE